MKISIKNFGSAFESSGDENDFHLRTFFISGYKNYKIDSCAINRIETLKNSIAGIIGSINKKSGQRFASNDPVRKSSEKTGYWQRVCSFGSIVGSL
jgi:hypothetical protein